MTFEQLLAVLPEGFDTLSKEAQIDALLGVMVGGYKAKKVQEAKDAIRAEYEAKRKEIQDKANAELEEVQKAYGEKLA